MREPSSTRPFDHASMNDSGANFSPVVIARIAHRHRSPSNKSSSNKSSSNKRLLVVVVARALHVFASAQSPTQVGVDKRLNITV